MLAAIERQPEAPTRAQVLALVSQTLALWPKATITPTAGPQGAKRD